MNQDFNFFVFDFGSEYKLQKEEFLRCTYKIVIGSLIPWKKQIYYNFIELLKKDWGINDQYLFLSLYRNKRENKRCHCDYGITMELMPYIADPFQIETQHFQFFYKLLYFLTL